MGSPRRYHFHLRGSRGSFMEKAGFEKDLERGINTFEHRVLSSRDEIKKTLMIEKKNEQRTLKSMGTVSKIAHTSL